MADHGNPYLGPEEPISPDTVPGHEGRHRSYDGRHRSTQGRHRPDPAAENLSVWATAQSTGPVQRRGRYVPESVKHPARMHPAIAAHAVAA